MKKLSLLFLSLTAFVFISCSDDDKATLVTTNFEGKLTEANSEFTTTGGTEIPNSGGVVVTTFKDPSNTLEFSHYYSPWGFAGGFTYCNYNDIITPGFENISAITGRGKNSNTYLVSTIANQTKMELLKSDKYVFKGAWVTNSTYAYLAIKDGNDNYKGETKFENGDWFKLTAIGYDSEDKIIDKIDFFLADYQNGKTKIVNTWEWFDFSRISTAEYIIFDMSSSDTGEYGINTPSYFCMDAITLEEK